MIKEKFEEKNQRGKFRGRKKEKSEFDQKVIDIARVTRVVKGGKRFSFRTTIVVGNKKGKVGVGIAKGADMKIAMEKSFAQAKKNVVIVRIKGNTIPYQVKQKLGAAVVLLKPALKGSGIVAGGAVRVVASLAGIEDITAKMLGSKSKIGNARATIMALQQFSNKKVKELEKDRMDLEKSKIAIADSTNKKVEEKVNTEENVKIEEKKEDTK